MGTGIAVYLLSCPPFSFSRTLQAPPQLHLQETHTMASAPYGKLARFAFGGAVLGAGCTQGFKQYEKERELKAKVRELCDA